jgi:hypothetical protein
VMRMLIADQDQRRRPEQLLIDGHEPVIALSLAVVMEQERTLSAITESA